MPSPPFLLPVDDDEATEALAAVLHAPGYGLPRTADCYLATVSAAHVLRCLAQAGLVVARPGPVAPQLEL